MRHKRYTINEQGRDFVIGDLHGCYDILMGHLKDLEFDNDKDRLFSVGDIVDRGPDSLNCLRLVKMPWFHAVQGNHEEFMLASVLDNCEGSISMWLHNGGMWSTQLEDPNELYDLCLEVEKLPVAITIETKNGPVGICHAEPPSTRWSDAQFPTGRDVQTMLWARRRIKNRLDHHIEEVTKVYCGHTPTSAPLTLGNVEYIDTNCCYSNNLTIKQIN